MLRDNIRNNYLSDDRGKTLTSGRFETNITVVFDLDESDIRKKTFTFDSNQNEHRSVKNQEFNHVEYQTSVKNVYFPQ